MANLKRTDQGIVLDVDENQFEESIHLKIKLDPSGGIVAGPDGLAVSGGGDSPVTAGPGGTSAIFGTDKGIIDWSDPLNVAVAFGNASTGSGYVYLHQVNNPGFQSLFRLGNSGGGDGTYARFEVSAANKQIALGIYQDGVGTNVHGFLDVIDHGNPNGSDLTIGGSVYQIAISSPTTFTNGFTDLQQLTSDPSPPAAGTVRRYYRTDLDQDCVIYPDGTVKRSATFT